MNKSKSPGLDGLPPELYIALWHELGPHLLNMLNSSIQKGGFSSNSNIAAITIQPKKKDKQPTECSSYRPLSLLNTDFKLYSKVLATRLESYYLVLYRITKQDS